jgi:DNA polymerase/3'-5' exonuclease PolX
MHRPPGAVKEQISPVYNSDVSNIFKRVADLLEIEGANEFRIAGLGAKRVSQLYKELNVTSLSELEKRAKAGEVQELAG